MREIGPTQAQANEVTRLCRKAFSKAIAKAEKLGITGAESLVIEWLGRTFAEHSDDMFFYAKEGGGDEG